MARARSPEKRQAILQAAVREIAEAGLGASTGRIARSAGLAEGTMFTYFSSKDNLLNELYIELKTDVYRRIHADFPKDSTLRERARHIWTNWAQRAGQNSPVLMPEYEESVGAIYKLLAAVRGNAEGDPKRIAGVVVKLANMEDVPKRLILGKDAEIRVKNVESARAEEAARYQHLTLSTDFQSRR